MGAARKRVANSPKSDIIKLQGEGTGLLKVNIQLFGTPNYQEMHTAGLQKTVNSLQKRIEEHRYKLENPARIYPEWENFPDERKLRELRHWNIEIERFKQQYDAANQELQKRGVLE